MTISSTIARNDYVGNGATVTWTYGFKIFDKSQIDVTVFNTLTGIETPLVLDVDYSVAGVGNDTGGTITQAFGFAIPAILPATSKITLKRNVPVTQPTALKNQGQFFPATIEDAFDRNIMILQQQQDVGDSAIRIRETEVPTTLNTLLPTITARANKVLGFDGLGDLIAVASSIPAALVSSFWTPILALGTSLASRTALGTKETVYAQDSGVSPNHVMSSANITAAGFVAPTSYVDGALFSFRAAFNSSASSTLDVNGLGAKQIFKKGITGFTYTGMQLSEYLVGENLIVSYNASIDKMVIVSSIFGQENLARFGISGASGGTAYDSGFFLRQLNFITTGHTFQFKADVANTGACTLNWNATGAKPLKISAYGALYDPPAGYFSAGDVVQVSYDGTNFLIAQDSSSRKLVAVANLTAVATTGNIALVAGQKYWIEYNLVQNTAAGRLDMRFNADAGANYKWGSITESSGAGPIVGNGANAATSIQITNADLVDIGSSISGGIEFGPKIGDNTIANIGSRPVYLTATNLRSTNTHGYYDGAAAVTSFNLLTTAGTFTGKILVYALPT